jgi:DNA repair protein RAD7
MKGESDELPSNPPLTTLNLSHNTILSSSTLIAILSHSGAMLTHLNINGWKGTSGESLNKIAVRAKGLRWLDVRWCREMDNFMMKVKEVKVLGCNQLTEHCPRKMSQF